MEVIKVAYILLGAPAFDKYSDRLERFGFTPVALPPEGRVNATVCTHADTLIFACGGEYAANADYVRTLPSFLHKYFITTDETPQGGYPTDAVFNALVVSGKLFAKLNTLSGAVLCIAKKNGLTPVNVRQGYARCSTLALDKVNAAVTADEGMARAMVAHGVDVLRISAGHIALRGCEYGFIGGASFVDETSRRVVFFGDLHAHPDGARIEAFLAHHGYSAVSMDGVLTDFGGAVIV